MPSTYTLNNGIELIATGEQSGTWGDTTNVNLGLIDTALDGQVTITLASAGSSGSPNTLAISDGSASNGRNRLVIFDDGGDLGATAFVQLTPNDAEKIVYVRNNLSGGRAITLFQGTYNASNDYEVPAGTTAVVFFNGGGAGAVAANVFNNAFFDSLRLGGVSVTAILDEDDMASDSATALATQQSIKAYVDAQVGANNELSEILANGNTSGGNDIQMTTTDEVQFRDAALKINSSVDGQLDIAADVELEIVAPTLDINASTAVTIDTTTMTMTGSVNVVGDLDVDNLNLNGNSIISTDTNGNIALTPNGTGEVDISKVDIDGGTIDGTVIGGSTPAAISGTTGTFSGDVTIADKIVHSGDTNTSIRFPANDTVTVETNGAERLRVESGGNFLVGKTIVDNTTVGHRLAATGVVSHVRDNGFVQTLNRLTSDGEILRLEKDGVIAGVLGAAAGGITLGSGASGNDRLNIASNGDISFYEDTGTTPKFFWDASAESLGIGTTSPSAKLTVNDAGSSLFSPNAYIAGATADVMRLGFDSGGARTNIVSGRDSGTSGATNGYMAFETRQSGGGMTEAMRITSAGNVGIGVTAPDARLVVSDTTQNLQMRVGAITAGRDAIIRFQGRNAAGTTNRFADIKLNADAGVLTLMAPATIAPATDALNIITGGNVGIGTTAPAQLLHLRSATPAIEFDDSAFATIRGRIYSDEGNLLLEADYNNGRNASNIAFNVDGSERARIDASGNLLVGTTSTGDLGVSNSGVLLRPDFIQIAKTGTTAHSVARFYNGNGEVGSISTSASATSFNTSSDYRLKEDVQPMVGSVDRLMALKPVNFAWKVDGSRVDGFLAHEAQEVVPEAVTGIKDAVDKDGKPQYQGIDQSKLVPLLTAALQEALKKIEALEARVAALEA